MNYKDFLLAEIEKLEAIEVTTIEEAVEIEQEIYALMPRSLSRK